MATREKGAGLLRFPRRDRVGLSRRALMTSAEAAAGFLLGAVLAGAEWFGIYAPFGVAAAAAGGSGLAGFCTTAGACLGYLCLEGLTDGMRYAAAAILTYSVAFAFYDTRLYAKAWFMPGIACLLSAMTGVLARAGAGWYGEDLVFFVTEVLLTGLATSCYTTVFHHWPAMLDAPEALSPQQRAGLLMLLTTVLMALGRVELLDYFSLGRLLALVGLLLAARRGVGQGVLVGACSGVALDLADGTEPYCCLVFTLAGLACGLCRERKKYVAALAGVLAIFLGVLWTWEGGRHSGLLIEAVLGGVLFLFCPWEPVVAATSPQPEGAWFGEVPREVASRRLTELATAFHALHETLQATLHPQPTNQNDPATVFTRTADRICAACVLRQTCWQKDYEDTRRACNDASTAMLTRGRLLPTDFPGTFSARCVHLTAFVAQANQEFTAFLRRRQSLRRAQETNQLLCSQYACMDTLMARAAAELAAELTPDLPRKRRLDAFLKSLNLPNGCVYYSRAGRLLVETPVEETLLNRAVHRELEEVLAVPLHTPETLGGRLVFHQAEPYRALVAMEGSAKRGERVSGDTGVWFRRSDGLLFLLLCDGMGSGEAAQAESAQAVKLLEGFLQAGMGPEQALETVAGALSLRASGGSTTVDLLTIDLFTGRCQLCKLGAAATYVCRAGKVKRATGQSFPAGILPETPADHHTFRGETGDWIVMLSDGILCGEEDDWLRQIISTYPGESPNELARLLLQASQQHCDAEDDATVLAIHLCTAASPEP